MGLLQRKDGIGSSFSAHVRSQLASHPEHAESLLRAYRIAVDSDQDDGESLIRILTFATDIGYRAPAHALVNSFPGDAFLLEFTEPNPWNGAFKGQTTHVLDVAFLFQNHNELLQQRQVDTAKQLARSVVAFVNGAEPWEKHDLSGSRAVAVFRDGTKACKSSNDTATTGYNTLKSVGQDIGLDRLADLVVSFVFGAPSQ